jgi:hypothetical protein
MPVEDMGGNLYLYAKMRIGDGFYLKLRLRLGLGVET